ncbi:MAG: DsrE/DsrF/DrsH-like family protein [bacterium]
MKICIIGGVAGGASAAARLRRLDEKARIIIFERGDYISFANCGLPYHISGKIKERSRLLLQTPESFLSRFQVEVRIKNEVLAINPRQKKVHVKNVKTGEEYHELYDYLILSPGAYPFVPPMEGSEARMFMRLRDIPDMDAIIAHIKNHTVREAVIIGGGFIGVEMAENLIERGIKTHLVEMMDQVMAPFDFEMANIIHARLVDKGICLHLADGVQKIVGDTKGKVILNSGTELNADLVIAAIGVRPDAQLAKNAGLRIGPTGAIAVDEAMRTSDPHIFALGDAVETPHFLGGKPVFVPLAGPANKQGRIAADNICGISSRYTKTLGTSILKVFDLQAASVGLNEKTARKNNINYQAIHLHPFNHAGYYPGASQMTLKILFEVPGGRVLGSQCIGADGVDKRIDVIATAIHAGMTVYDLEQLELSYAPPFGSAKDPVNMAGFVGSNVLKGLVKVVTCDRIGEIENPLFLDVRTSQEFSLGSIPKAVNIPVDELRKRIQELPKDRHIVVTCQVGIRAYVAYRILKQSGFDRLYNLSGGYKSYGHYTARIAPNPDYCQGPPPLAQGDGDGHHATGTAASWVPLSASCAPSASFAPSAALSACAPSPSSVSAAAASSAACCCPPCASSDSSGGSSVGDISNLASGCEVLDLTGLQCPGPIMRLAKKLETMKAGDKVLANASDPGFEKDLPAYCRTTGHKVLSAQWKGKDFLALIEKSANGKDKEERMESKSQGNGDKENGMREKKKTIVVFSNDLDRALATFIIANGARAMGSEVTLFFTFWGLNILRKEQPAAEQQKPLIDQMFGMMMPKGAARLKLSKLNMFGLGTGMMKQVMREKNVSSLSQLIRAAQESGIKFVACSMSMDVMGIKKEELIDGVEIGGVAQYLSEADQSNMNLFI